MVDMVTFHCKRCGVPFCVQKSVVRNRREQSKMLSCPNSHRNVIGLSGGEFVLELPTQKAKKRKLNVA